MAEPNSPQPILETAPQLDAGSPMPSAEATHAPPAGDGIGASKPVRPRKSNHRQLMNKIYALPAPIRTFPLPTFVPHNPLSLFHILYTWISQTISPPSSHFETLYQGRWSPETRSVHVTDNRSIRGLWEQGFYGKGTLSRSEPNWLEKEKNRAAPAQSKTTSEVLTQQRRIERQQTKWERARKEREAIEQRLSEEAEADEATNSSSLLQDTEVAEDSDASLTDEDQPLDAKAIRTPPAPVTPVKLLALPNSALDLYEYEHSTSDTELEWQPMLVKTLADEVAEVVRRLLQPSSSPPSDGASMHPDGQTSGYSLILNTVTEVDIDEVASHPKSIQTFTNGISSSSDEVANGSVHSDDTAPSSNSSFTPNCSALANGSSGVGKIKCQKSVRFSPTVEKNTFIQSEPPSPDRAVSPPAPIILPMPAEGTGEEITTNQEHFQLTMEEAFFLSYALGALTILPPITEAPISNDKLLELFRQTSSFPPLATPSTSPDDSFMLNYIVYHHYRSLGWVVRGGAKFSCDLMLYQRGPVFNHAEFGILILPAYTDEYWSRDEATRKHVKRKEKRTWHWLHCIHRVLTQAKKTLILVYVDVPPPSSEGGEMALDKLFGRYKVREVILQRFSPNRQK